MSLEQELIMTPEVNKRLLSAKGVFLFKQPSAPNKRMTKEERSKRCEEILDLMDFGKEYLVDHLCKYCKPQRTRFYLKLLVDQGKVKIRVGNKSGGTQFHYSRVS